MTYFSESWSDDVRMRLSNPKWTVGLTGFVSVSIHCIILFFVLPFTPARIPIEASFGQVSIQLVASKPPSTQKPRATVVEPAQKTLEPPKEIVREITPVPTPEPVVPVVAAMPQIEPQPVTEVVSAEPVSEATEPAESAAEPSPVTATDAQPSTGSQADNDQEIHVSAPLYSSNPKPEYPLAAQRALSEGRVLLRALVSANGDVISISVDKSSGYRILDMAAERAVKNWKFIPARRGSSTIQSECIVPIAFHLKKGVSLE